jgi:NAD(P)-dependent dehydrogenase (short-subunit alcohol dehydrogenase family)
LQKGAHLVIELAFQFMGKKSDKVGAGRGGVVVSLSSTAGITCVGEMNTVPAYTTSKHAVTTLTRTFGTDLYLNRTGVRVIALAPYWVETPLIKDGFKMWTEDEEARQTIVKAAEGKEFLK